LPNRTAPSSRALLAAGLTIAALAPLSACQLHKKLPWVSTEAIIETDASIPPLALESSNGLHVVTYRAPSGGWTVAIDRSERIADGTRLYVTIRRPDPAFSHTQALVDLHALSNTPDDQPVELVARVLERDADPKDRIYARVTPVESLDD